MADLKKLAEELEAEDVRNRQAQYPENAPPQIRSPADSIVAPQFPRYRLCQTPCHPFVKMSVYAAIAAIRALHG